MSSNPLSGPRFQAALRECEVAARQDSEDPTWKSQGLRYDQALAVRVVLRFGGQDALTVLEKARTEGRKEAPEVGSEKRLKILLHPDKCKHPEAQTAFQILTKDLMEGDDE